MSFVIIILIKGVISIQFSRFIYKIVYKKIMNAKVKKEGDLNVNSR